MDQPIKHDTEKPRYELLPWLALEEAARAMGHGAAKYSDFNYLKGDGMKWSRLYGAACRHLAAWHRREEADADSGLHPLAHAAASVLMLLELVLREHGKDGRPPGHGEV